MAVINQYTEVNLNKLTRAELVILQHVSNGLTSKAIAEKQSISLRTVEKHRSNIILKLGISKKGVGLRGWVESNPFNFNSIKKNLNQESNV
jgi:DNA-binding NarL/FixJ family response regulator